MHQTFRTCSPRAHAHVRAWLGWTAGNKPCIRTCQFCVGLREVQASSYLRRQRCRSIYHQHIAVTCTYDREPRDAGRAFLETRCPGLVSRTHNRDASIGNRSREQNLVLFEFNTDWRGWKPPFFSFLIFAEQLLLDPPRVLNFVTRML